MSLAAAAGEFAKFKPELRLAAQGRQHSIVFRLDAGGRASSSGAAIQLANGEDRPRYVIADETKFDEVNPEGTKALSDIYREPRHRPSDRGRTNRRTSATLARLRRG